MTVYAVRVAMNEFADDTEIRAIFDSEAAATEAVMIMEELRAKYPNVTLRPNVSDFNNMKYDIKKAGLSLAFHPYDLMYTIWEIAPMMVHSMPASGN